MQQQALRSAGTSTVLYVVKRKWHVDIGFAVTDLQPPLASLRADFPAAHFLLFGFGDRHYLLDKDRGLGGMLAALWPGPGLMLATGLTTTAQQAFGADAVIEVALSDAQARAMQAFIWRTLAPSDALASPLRAGPYEGSWYYSASVRYSALHTCNTWAAEALQAASLPVHSVGVELSGQLWSQVRPLDAWQRADPAGAPR
jgi:hypothetical protein